MRRQVILLGGQIQRLLLGVQIQPRCQPDQHHVRVIIRIHPNFLVPAFLIIISSSHRVKCTDVRMVVG